MDITLTGTQAILSILLLAMITIGLVFTLRYILNKNNTEDLTEKYKDKKWASPMMGRNKYPEANGFSFTGPLFRYGIFVALAVVLFAFSWTTFDRDVFIPDGAMNFDEVIEQVPIRTAEPPKPPPPPPPPVIEEVPDEEIIEDEQPEFESMDVEVEDEIIAEEVEEAPPPPPPPPPKEEEIFKVVEQMPRFPGCENKGSNKEKEECATMKMLQYIYKNLKYPAIARENGVEGMVVVQFVVNKKGKVDQVNVVRDIGAGCGEAAAKVVKAMNDLPKSWTPGKQRGRPVKVLYTLPVKFKLEG